MPGTISKIFIPTFDLRFTMSFAEYILWKILVLKNAKPFGSKWDSFSVKRLIERASRMFPIRSRQNQKDATRPSLYFSPFS